MMEEEMFRYQMFRLLVEKSKAETKLLSLEPEYSLALADKVIKPEELAHVGILNVVKNVLDNGKSGDLDKVWNSYAKLLETTPDEAENIWSGIESRVHEHYTKSVQAFGDYLDKFSYTKQ
jgi:hypothetical protein